MDIHPSRSQVSASATPPIGMLFALKTNTIFLIYVPQAGALLASSSSLIQPLAAISSPLDTIPSTSGEVSTAAGENLSGMDFCYYSSSFLTFKQPFLLP